MPHHQPRGDPGRAAQVDPIKPTLKPPGTHRLKRECDEPLSNFAFNFNLRGYTQGVKSVAVGVHGWAVQVDSFKPVLLKAPMVSALESYNMMSRFQTLLSISTCAATARRGVPRAHSLAGGGVENRGLHSSTSQLNRSRF